MSVGVVWGGADGPRDKVANFITVSDGIIITRLNAQKATPPPSQPPVSELHFFFTKNVPNTGQI